MRWTCGTYGGKEESLQGLGGETWRKKPFG